MNRYRMIGFCLLAMLLVLPAMRSAPYASAQKDEPSAEGQVQTPTQLGQTEDPESPEVNDYLWIAGSSFKPRSSSISYQYVSNGCITSLTGGGALNQSFTVPFRVPNGSVIRGVRFFYYDASAQSSRLSLTSYDGAGGFTDHVLITSQGTAGEGNLYQDLAAPYTIDTAQRGFVINWYPDVAGSTMRLCGARIFYDRGNPVAQVAASEAQSGPPPTSDARTAETPLAFDYYFLAGSSFSRRDSATSYLYGSSGCVYTNGGSSLFTIDLNMPDGVRVLGARFYFNDTSATDTISFYLTDYNGLGGFRDLLAGSSSDGGFGSVYVAMGAAYDPYRVDQFTYSLNAIAIGADKSTAQLCGVRVFYDTAGALAEQPDAEEPGRAADPLESASDAKAPKLEPAALTPQDFAHDLQLNQGVVAQGLRVYYSNYMATNGYVQTWNYTGSTADFLGTTPTTGQSGFGSNYQAFATAYTVDHFTASLGVVPWVVYNRTYKFCGVRVFYTEGATGRYRFIAGSSFHPRNSDTRYTYEGTGCIGLVQSTTFAPMTTKAP